MVKRRRAETSAPRVAEAIPHTQNPSSNDECQFVTFHLGGEQLAFRVGETAEIIRVPPLVHMPLGPASVLGLMNLRGTVLPVVSLRRLLGFDGTASDDATRIVVISGAAPVGFAVDRIDGLATASVNAIERAERGSGAIDSAVVEGVIKGSEGSQPIKLLAPQPLLKRDFSHLAKPRALSAPISTSGELVPSADTTHSELLSFVTFDLDGQEYGLPLGAIQEIIPLPIHVSELARAETAVRGVVTLRERLLPIVSLRALLGMAEDARADGRKVVVLSVGEALVGVVADRTREIVRVEAAAVDPAPALLTRGAGEAEITSICRLDGGKRLVAVLSPDHLFRSDLMKRIIDRKSVV